MSGLKSCFWSEDLYISRLSLSVELESYITNYLTPLQAHPKETLGFPPTRTHTDQTRSPISLLPLSKQDYCSCCGISLGTSLTIASPQAHLVSPSPEAIQSLTSSHHLPMPPCPPPGHVALLSPCFRPCLPEFSVLIAARVILWNRKVSSVIFVC